MGGLRRDRAHAARRWATTRRMLVQSGKPVGVFRTHEWAPRVLIANSNLVPEWGNWDEFRRLEALGPDDVRPDDRRVVDLHRHARASCRAPTSASPRSRAARFGGTLAGTITLTAGLGGMGGAQPLAVTMNGGVALCIEVDRAAHRAPARDALPRRGRRLARRRGRALRAARETSGARCRSGSSATPPTSCPQLLRAAASRPTSSPTRRAPTTRCRLRPGRPHARGGRRAARAPIPSEYVRRSRASDGRALRGDGRLPRRRAPRSSTTATACAPRPQLGGFERAFDYPGFLPAYIRPLFCEGKGPFRWVALSGDPADIAATDRAVLEEFPDDERLAPLDRAGRRAGRLPGAAGAHLLARLRRAPPARAALQRDGAQRRADGADRDRPRPPRLGLGRLARTARPRRWPTAPTRSPTGRCSTRWSTPRAGATWVSIHHGGGVGIGRSIHAGMVCVADGTDLAAQKLERVLDRRPGHGRDPPRRRRLRPRAVEVADERGVRIPMRESEP